jgi:hypothetical protein
VLRASLALTVLLGCSPLPASTDHRLAPGDLRGAGTREYQPGDRLLLEAGAEYRGTLTLKIAGGGDPRRPVEITSDGEKPATILAGDDDGLFISDSGVVVKNLCLMGSGRGTNRGCGVRMFNGRPGGDKRSGIRISGLKVSGFSRAGISVESWPEDRSDSGFKDVVIENCNVYDGVHYGIWSNGPEQPRGSWKYPHAAITVRGCEVYGIEGDPAKHDNHSGNGIMIGSVDGALIERCCAHDNGGRNGSHHGGPVGIWSYCARKVVIQHCESYANRSGERPIDGGGFDLDGGVVESVMQYNYSHDNDGAGYLMYSYKDAPHEFRDNIVRFNVSIYDGRRGEYGGIVVGHHGNHNVDSLIHHNLVAVRPQEKAKACALIMAQTRDMKVLNNVFIVRKGAYLAGTWGLKPGEGLRLAGNRWLVEGEPVLLQGNDPCESLEKWLEKAGLRGGEQKNQVARLEGPVIEKAPTCWPSGPATLGELFRPDPDQPSAVDVSGVPERDFLGRPVVTSRFAGPYSPR